MNMHCVWGLSRHSAWDVGLSILYIERASMYPQLYEVKRDALMMRTRNRPLPQGRVTPRHALAFALATGVGGVSILYWKVSQHRAACKYMLGGRIWLPHQAVIVFWQSHVPCASPKQPAAHAR